MSRVAALLLLVFSFPVFGGAPYRVRDINTSYTDSPRSSLPARFTDLGGHAVFSANTSDAGAEPWVTDGTAAGTKILLDVNAGTEDSSPVFFPLGSTALFFATDATHGRELWHTDGTPQGTSLVKDIMPGSASAIDLNQAVMFDGKLVFAVQPPVNGQPGSLWSSDGTAAGTKVFATFHPTPGVTGPISMFAAVNHRVVAVSPDGLWSTDGAVSELIDPNAKSGNPLIVVGGRLFFVAYDAGFNSILYVSDGTKAGTHSVFMLATREQSSSANYGLAPAGNGVLCNASTSQGVKLTVSDGTGAGTHVLGGFPPIMSNNQQLTQTVVVNGFTYFHYYDQLWRTDGTDTGTERIGPALGTVGTISGAGNSIYFPVYIVNQKPALYAYDTMTGILRTVYGNNGMPMTGGSEFAPFGNAFLFAGSQRGGDEEPWITDGTASGTREILEIAPNGPASSNPQTFVAAGDSLIFSAAENDQRSVWRTDGTEAGTTKIRDTYFPGSQYDDKLFSFRDHAYFKTQKDLWSIDSAGHVTKTTPTPDNDGGQYLAPGPDAIYIISYGGGLVRWDGVSAKGERLYSTEFYTTAWVDDFIGKPVIGNNRALIFINDGKAETIRKWSLNQSVMPPFAAGGFVYVLATDGHNLEVWRSDGTPTGTALAVTIPNVTIPGVSPDQANLLIMATGPRLFFVATDAGHGQELWTTDGTPAGTHLTLDIAAGTATSAPAPLARLGDRLLFTADDGISGKELWITDGTPEGTKLVKDIFPGKSSSQINKVIVTDGLAYFTATQADGKRGLWQSDGSDAGTKPISDLSNYSSEPAAAGNRVYFTKSDEAGTELWALPIDPVSRLRIADLRVTEGSSAHFIVTLTHPSDRRVTVDYATSDVTATAGSDYTAASGSIAFEPGETQKEIVVPTTADSIDEDYEVFRVTLRNPSGADIDRGIASALIEGQTPAADLQITAELRPRANGVSSAPFVRMKNNGPATVANATMQFAFAAGSAAGQTTVRDLAAGSETTWPDFSTYAGDAYWWARATTAQRESNLVNNTVIGFAARDKSTGGVLSFAPADLHPGDTAFLEMAVANLNSSMTAVSSNPAVVSVSPLIFEATRATATLTAKSAGTATISVAGLGEITVTVLAPGASLKLVPTVTRSMGFAHAGTALPIYISVYGLTPAGIAPSGTVTVSEGSVVRGTGTLAPGFVTVLIDPGAVGHHSYTIDYSGDANFTGSSLAFTSDTSQGDPKVALTAEVLPDGQTKITMTVNGSPLATPTGTITFTEIGQPAGQSFALAAVSAGVARASRTFAFPPGDHTVTATYNGDGNYFSAAGTITVGPRRRTSAH